MRMQEGFQTLKAMLTSEYLEIGDHVRGLEKKMIEKKLRELRDPTEMKDIVDTQTSTIEKLLQELIKEKKGGNRVI